MPQCESVRISESDSNDYAAMSLARRSRTNGLAAMAKAKSCCSSKAPGATATYNDRRYMEGAAPRRAEVMGKHRPDRPLRVGQSRSRSPDTGPSSRGKLTFEVIRHLALVGVLLLQVWRRTLRSVRRQASCSISDCRKRRRACCAFLRLLLPVSPAMPPSRLHSFAARFSGMTLKFSPFSRAAICI